MGRNALAVLGGLVAWAVIATVLNFGVRAAIPAYTAAEPLLAFSLTMKIARLALAALASLIAGFLTRSIAPVSRWAPWIVGGILLLMFVPIHIQIGARLPLWYHLFFLLTLAPLVVLGGRLRLRALGAAPATTQNQTFSRGSKPLKSRRWFISTRNGEVLKYGL